MLKSKSIGYTFKLDSHLLCIECNLIKKIYVKLILLYYQ